MNNPASTSGFSDPRLRPWAEAEIEATLERLPAPLLEQACRIPVTLEPIPNAELQAEGIARDTLGLFTGADYANEGHIPLPAQIILFLENLWDFAGHDPGEYRQELRTTLLHELGHYLGLNEDDLTERGLE